MNFKKLSPELQEQFLKSANDRLAKLEYDLAQMEKLEKERQGILTFFKDLGLEAESNHKPKINGKDKITPKVIDELSLELQPHRLPKNAVYDKNQTKRYNIAVVLNAADNKPMTTREIYEAMVLLDKRLGGANEHDSIKLISGALARGSKDNYFKNTPNPNGNKKMNLFSLR